MFHFDMYVYCFILCSTKFMLKLDAAMFENQIRIQDGISLKTAIWP